MTVDCEFKIKPPKLEWFKGSIAVKTDPRVTIKFDDAKMLATMQMVRAKLPDEAKYKVEIRAEKTDELLDFAGFSVFVKGENEFGAESYA